MIKPNTLKTNDQVAIVAPSRSAKPEVVQKAAAMIRALGLEPVVYPSCCAGGGKREASPAERARDIHDAFRDPGIRALFALRAGSGTLSLLPLLDYELIRSHPKLVLGFSDITGLHLALNKLCGLPTLHGPLATSHIWHKSTGFDPYTHHYLHQNLFTDQPLGLIANPPEEPLACLCPGTAAGRLTGGNLTLLARTIGSEYEVDTEGRILFMEDMGEELDSLRAMLLTLKQAGKFADCRGIILGTWIQCGEEIADAAERKQQLTSLFTEMLSPFCKPVLANLRGGHNIPMITLPLGTHTELDAAGKTIRFTEAVSRGQ